MTESRARLERVAPVWAGTPTVFVALAVVLMGRRLLAADADERTQAPAILLLPRSRSRSPRRQVTMGRKPAP